MDALELLTADHERAKSLYELLRSETDAREQSILFGKLRAELVTQSQVESQVFYPAFKNYPDFKAMLGRAFEENRNIKNQLKRLESSQATLGDSREALDQTMKIVVDHVRWEEDEFFPKVRKLLRRNEREALGRHLQASREVNPRAA